MDSDIKTGKVYLQPQQAGKKWKPVLLSLFPQNSSGVGRLEIQNIGGGIAGGNHGAGVRRHHQPHIDKKLKVVRLSELISVLRLPPNAEACPMDNMSAFCVETQDRTLVFAALKDDCVDWVEKLGHSTVQIGVGSNQLHMEENQIYASADEVSEFWVVVQRTDAAIRCDLQGAYWLQVGRQALMLRETRKKNIVREWPYELLRRYGKDKLALTIEAGRRCDSGPGSFTFETPQAEKMFTMIQNNIKWKTSTVAIGNQEGEKVANIQAHSPLPKIRDMTSIAVILENKLKTQEKRCASQESAHAQEDSSECISVQPAPITLMPLPQVPTHDSSFKTPSEAVYANPADCIQSRPKPEPTMALYVDPACVLPLKPPSSVATVTPRSTSSDSYTVTHIDHPDPVYSEVYDKISPNHPKPIVTSLAGEYIYTAPVVKEVLPNKTENNPDPFAHLYAQVCKTTASSGSSAHTSSNTTAQHIDDVIYENLGII